MSIKGLPITESAYRKSMYCYETEEMKADINNQLSGKVEVWKHGPTGKIFERESDYELFKNQWIARYRKELRQEEAYKKARAKAREERPIVAKAYNEEKERITKIKKSREAHILTNDKVIKTIQLINDNKTQIKKCEQAISICEASLKNQKTDLGKEFDKIHSVDRRKLASLRAKLIRLNKWI